MLQFQAPPQHRATLLDTHTMRPLSATECITPAIERTKLVLFSPFRAGRTWKLCAASYGCIAGSLFFPFPILIFIVPFASKQQPIDGLPLAIMAAISIAFLAIFTWIFYLCSRLQFAYFDIVVNRGEFVAPAWRKYRDRVLPWTGVKIVLGTVLTAILAVPFGLWFRHIIPLMAQIPPALPGQRPDPQMLKVFATIWSGYGVMMVAMMLVILLLSLLHDFIVPSIALENTGIPEAFRRMGTLIDQEPKEFAMYVLLKSVFAVIGSMGATIAWEIVFILLSLILGGLTFGVGYVLHLVGVASTVLTAMGVFVAIVWYFIGMASILFAIGPVYTWMDAYALYFLGGRYPMLGDLLDASTPAPPMVPINPFIAPDPPPFAPPA